MALSAVEILDNGAAVRVTWIDGSAARFHAIWLRDNAQDAATRDAGNGQRLISLAEIPDGVALTQAEVDAGALKLNFSDGHKTAYQARWLAAHRYDAAPKSHPRTADVTLWRGDHALFSDDLPRLQADAKARRAWLAAVARDGVAHISGLRTEPGSLEAVVDLFGYVRETNYGRLFEVRSEIDPTNLAYTNLGLQAHTDNPYRDPVPGLQILSCLENTVAGGESSVVDGFAMAAALRQVDPDGFEALATFPARFEYAGAAGVRLEARRPILERGPDGEMRCIRFNNRSLAAAIDVPFDQMERWYSALRRLSGLIDAPENAVTFRLDPGEAFIVDNTRVLHARAAFSSGGSRWLQGCYADLDGLRSTLASLEVA